MTRGTFICLDFYCIFFVSRLVGQWIVDRGLWVDRSRGLPTMDCGMWDVDEDRDCDMCG